MLGLDTQPPCVQGNNRTHSHQILNKATYMKFKNAEHSYTAAMWLSCELATCQLPLNKQQNLALTLATDPNRPTSACLGNHAV